MGEPEPNLREVKAGEHEKFDLKSRVESVVAEGETLIESLKYPEAFEALAKTLEDLERPGSTITTDRSGQKVIRNALGRLWKKFIAESTNRKKFSARLYARGAEIDSALEKTKAKLNEPAQKKSPDLVDYEMALSKQQINQDSIIVFPNAASQEHAIGRGVRRYFQAMESHMDIAMEPEMRRIAVEATAFWRVLPLTRILTEGYVKPLLRGDKPISSDLIRVTIVNFLNQVTPIAELLADAERDRDKAWPN